MSWARRTALGLGVCVACVAARTTHAQEGWRRERMIPVVENLTGYPDVPGIIRLTANRVLKGKGYDVPEGPEVDRLIASLAIPAAGPLPAAKILPIFGVLKVDYVAIVTPRFFLEPTPRARGPVASAAMGVAVRIVNASGGTYWSGSIGYIDEQSAIRRPVPVEEVRRQVGLAASERVMLGAPRAKPDPALVALANTEARRAATTVARVVGPGPTMDAAIEQRRSFEGGPRFKMRIGRRLKGVQAAPAPPPPDAPPNADASNRAGASHPPDGPRPAAPTPQR